jgi:uncharacterized protein (TIGR03435 family)
MAATRRCAVSLPLVIAILNLAPTRAQSLEPRPEFEVASVRPYVPDNRRRGIFPSPGRFNAVGVPLKLLMQNAYRVQPFLIVGGPSWIGSDTYDVVAKTDGPASTDQVRLMLQMLLEERFKLKVRRETREVPVYALVVGKNGPKLPTAEGECVAGVLNGLPPRLPARGKVPSLPCDGFSVRPNQGVETLYGLNVSMSAMARGPLSQMLERPVVDKTGLAGRYFVELEWTPVESRPQVEAGNPGQSAPDSSGPDIFMAIQEQLGLKLEPAKAPVEVIVIDHVERPEAN